MDKKHTVYFVILIFYNIVLLQGDLLYKPNHFPYSRCKQTSGNVVCEKLNFSKGQRKKASLWPPGPYAIPMSHYGCPESQSRGWSTGALTVTLAEPNQISQQLKLNFCVKDRNNTELDKEAWIPQKYKIYMKGAACPSGFEEVIRTIYYSDYDTYGYLPNIAVSEKGIFTKYINISMCERNVTSSETLENNQTFGMLDTNFVLLKNRDDHCPEFKETSHIFTMALSLGDTESIYCALYDYSKIGKSGKAVQLMSDYSLLIVDAPESKEKGKSQNLLLKRYYATKPVIIHLFRYKGVIKSNWTDCDIVQTRLVWYQFDVRRSLHVFKVHMLSLMETKHYYFGVGSREAYKLSGCYYDDVKWSFLFHKALECIYRIQGPFKRELYLMNVQARFVTLLFERFEWSSKAMNSESFEIFISDLETLDEEWCNEDLGMNDGSVQDFQITASSWIPQHPASEARPFSSGWCIDISDDSPWLLVNLIATMTVEGLSIWNSPSSDFLNPDDPWSSFNLYYGANADDLRMYTDMRFGINLTKPSTEVQMFVLPNAVQARFIQLVPETYGDHFCLRFEIQGCTLSGIPTVNCYNDSEMFEINAELITANETLLTDTYFNKSIEDCNDLCMLEEKCSSTSVNEKGVCVQYMHSQYDIWKMNYDASGKWSAKLCFKDPVELFPTFYDLNGNIAANVQLVEKAAVITSIGYPFSTGSRYEYKWIINYLDQRYVRFVFTNVSIDLESVEKERCHDKLIIGTDLQDRMKGRTIDDRFNGLVFVVETSETLIFMTFIPCIGKFAPSKFRVIVTDEETPACLSIDTDIHWSEKREEICTKSKMILTSMSILNLPFVNVEERFQIRARKHHSIQIHFLHFYIVCPIDRRETRSKFTITDHIDKRKYCNTDRPPKVIYSKEASVLVFFQKFEDPEKSFIGTEGFRLQYTTKSHSLSSMTDFEHSVKKGECEYNGKTYENGQTFEVDGNCRNCRCEEGSMTCIKNQKCSTLSTLEDDHFCGNVTCANPLCDDEVRLAGLCCSLCRSACSKKLKKCYNIFPATCTWTEAASVCLKYNQHLVTVQSKQELHYINYLLREQRYRDNIRKSKHASFRAHIGLRRISVKSEKKRYVWLNNYALIFTAWKPGHPSVGDCTQTYFQPFNTNRTWESEDCFNEHADFFICQTQIEDKKEVDTIFNTKTGSCNIARAKDRQEVNVTYSGKVCQNWSNLTKEAKVDFRERFSDNVTSLNKSSNNCKNPTKLGILGCYTADATNLWEPCILQQNNSVYAISENTYPGGFTCHSNGLVIPMVNRCDKTFDCEDSSDELLCMGEIKEHGLITTDGYINKFLPDRLEKGSYHLCRSKEWISAFAKCDGVIDCLDASDEVDCSRNKTGCDDNEFSCGDGSCIKLSKVCDSISDCAEAKDEFCELQSCEFNEFSCKNEQCIPIEQRCNAIQNCVDRSDEINCDSCEDSFHCDIDKCIPYIRVCDNFPDCDDGSDENTCQQNTRSSCDKWWENGYHESGQYVVGGISVYCDFSLLGTADGQIKMESLNLDVDIGYNNLYTKSLTENYFRFWSLGCLYHANYSCQLEVKSACHFPEYVASVYDDPFQDFAFPFCHCTVATFESTNREHYFPEMANRYQTVYTFRKPLLRQCSGKGQDTNNSRYYRLDTVVDHSIYVTRDVIERKVPIDISIRKLSCIYEYKTTVSDDTIDCDGDNTTISKAMLCMYDVDATGYVTGCRSGSHLQDCDTFSCSNNTVKYPGSYCIPLRFVCDGSRHCPGGEDEHNCSCTDSSREVIVMIEDTLHQSDSKIAAVKLAKQFYTSGSIVRLLYYKSQSRIKGIDLIHRLLDIQEERVNEFEAFSDKCGYKSLARNLLPLLRFTERKTVGIVFIEDSVESSTVAQIIFSNLSKPAFTLYRVLKASKSIVSKSNRYKFVKDVNISRWDSLHSIGYRYFPEICQEASYVPCVGGYRCSSSKQCIPLEQICDGVIHCSNGDDERLCNFKCQKKCTCVDQTVNCRAAYLNITDILALSVNTRSADLSMNPDIKDILSSGILRFPFMFRLDLSSCEIEIISATAFSKISNLMSLNISYNRIKELSGNIFIKLGHLTYLNLDGNYALSSISSSAFKGLTSIKHLRISGTKLKKISSYTFSNLTLESIDISYNKIEEIENHAFCNLSVQKINFEGNDILKFHKLLFNNVTSLQELRTPAFKFCCISPCYVDEDKCYPLKNEFSSCGDLMRHPVLQAILWLVGIASLLGNLCSIVYRLVYDRERLKIGYGIFVTNLATADLLMGVYLIMIAVVDSIYRKRYIFMDDQWRNSIWCTTAGVLSTVSSEASVLFLCLITLDRLLVIKYPFGTVRFTPKIAYICCGICWVIAFTLAVIPVVYTSHFQNRFYSRSGVCIALPLTHDKPPGWVYSVSIFVGLNFSTFILVAVGQLSIFLELRRATHGVRKTQMSRKRDLQVARNLILVATTDFLCWFPIGLMGIMALNGYSISGDVYAWTAVFILPFNSALNPFLYTVSAIVGKKSFNPSVEEQDRTEFQKEIGSAIMQFADISRTTRMIREAAPVSKARSVQDVLKEDGHMSISTVTAISNQLANYLRLLHEASVGVEQLSEANTYIRNTRKKAKRPLIFIDTKLTLITDERMKQDNIHQFGLLLRKMIASCDRKELRTQINQ